MNIHTDAAGCVTDAHIESRGFKVFNTMEGRDIDSSWSIPQYQNEKVRIVGGYWNWSVIDRVSGKELWSGWWNSNDEFDQTMREIGAII